MPVPSVRQSHYCKIGLPTNYHHLLQETWHVSSQFVTIGPGTDLAGADDIKLLNRSGAGFSCRWFITIMSVRPTQINSNLKSETMSISGFSAHWYRNNAENTTVVCNRASLLTLIQAGSTD